MCFNRGIIVGCWIGIQHDQANIPKYRYMTVQNTRASLLLRIRDQRDEIAWGEFVEVYMPLIYSYGLKHGLQAPDAADLSQDTMRQVVRSIETFDYDPNRGSFRGWLLTVARNQLRRMMNQRDGSTSGSGDTSVAIMLSQQASPSEEASWEREYQLQLFRWAAQEVRNEFRESTWQAFWLSVVEEISIAEVSQRLQLTPGAIYIARSRVLARIRSAIAKVEGESNAPIG
ncbi:MAG: sigma-70 family RNA polymerase sigma factor [Pirellula sp.]